MGIVNSGGKGSTKWREKNSLLDVKRPYSLKNFNFHLSFLAVSVENLRYYRGWENYPVTKETFQELSFMEFRGRT